MRKTTAGELNYKLYKSTVYIILRNAEEIQ